MKSLFSPTAKRIKLNTNPKINERIEKDIAQNIENYKGLSDEIITFRINELDREWDTEKTLELNFASVVLLSGLLGFTVSKKWFTLAGVASLFMIGHALQGWCPPLPIMRRFGIRSSDEICDEKSKLRYLRGDYNKI